MKRLKSLYQPRLTILFMKICLVCNFVPTSNALFILYYVWLVVVQVIFEELIFSEFHQGDVVPVICGKWCLKFVVSMQKTMFWITGSKSYIQAFIRIKSQDIVLCSEKYEWSKLVDGDDGFYFPACILMVLLIKEGSILFPSFDQDYICKVIDTLKLETVGWNQVYNSSPNFLLQTKPMESKKRREKKPSPQLPEYVSKTARLQALGKHQQQVSSGSSSTASLSPQK